MTFLTHTLTGIAAGKTIGGNGAIAFSILAANFPDLNVLWKKNLYTHHRSFTHYPVSLLITTGILVIASFFLNISIFAWLFLGLWALHLILDTFGIRAGLHIFEPFQDKEYSFTKLNKDFDANFRDIIHTGAKSGQFLIEVFVITALILYIIFF